MGSKVTLLLVGHVLDKLAELPDSSVQMCVTSPPYWGLRNYGTEPQTWPDGWVGHLGLEPVPQLYVDHLVQVFREVRRVLRKDGTLWLNLGDSMAARQHGWGLTDGRSWAAVHREAGDARSRGTRLGRGELSKSNALARMTGLKNKDLVGIPWMVAFALRDDGWHLRSDIIWAKSVSGQKEQQSALRRALQKAGLSPDQVHKTLAHLEQYVGTCMPESVRDRPTRSHEYLFLLTKSAKAYCQMGEVREVTAQPGRGLRADRFGGTKHGAATTKHSDGSIWTGTSGGRNRRSVWQISPKPYKGAHFATFPPALVEPCLLAGTSPKGQCPQCGAPWTPVYRKRQTVKPLERLSRDEVGTPSQIRSIVPGTDRYMSGRVWAKAQEEENTRPQALRAVALFEEHGLTLAHLEAIRSVGITDAGKAQTNSDGFGKNAPEKQALANEAKSVLKGYYREFLFGPLRDWQPETDAGALLAAKQACGADARGEYHGTATKAYAEGLAQDPSATKARILAGMGPKDVQWVPGCAHALDPVPQTVLDPFGGSGTTAEVALRYGRRAILIELNPADVPLIEARLAKVK